MKGSGGIDGESAIMEKKFVVIVALVVLAWFPISASAHKIVSEESGTSTESVDSVESCAVFEWTDKTQCTAYDTVDHHWAVTNNCSRGVSVQWADNAFGKPIRYGKKSGKPRRESMVGNLPPGETEEGRVGCVDKAELKLCVEYTNPHLRDHDPAQDCRDFFD